MEGNLNDSLRRMSIDSGLSMSPATMSPTVASQPRRKKKKRARSYRSVSKTEQEGLFQSKFYYSENILKWQLFGRFNLNQKN
jgi:hypothetical protein